VLLAGWTDAGQEDAYLMRLNGSDGSLDTSFDGPTGTGNGRVRYAITSGTDAAYAVSVAPTGEIYVGGTATPGGTQADPFLMKVNDDGTLDARFDGDSGTGNGIVQVAGTSDDELTWDMTFTHDGGVVLAGTSDTPTPKLFLARFAGAPVDDYDDQGLPGDHDWTAGNGFFGACLRSFTGTGASATWSAADPSCTHDDAGTTWRAIPERSGATKIGQLGAGATDGAAALRFALQVPDAQRPGRYVAPITFEVVAPAA
jgi:hypothetical protein